jgi:Cu/Ag efflux pump CusA
VSQLPIETPLGTHVPLSDAAEIALVPAPNEIKREGASRKIDVTFNVQGRDLGSVAREIEKRVRALDFEREYHPEFLGEYAAREESSRRLTALGALSLIGILLIIHADFRSVRLTALVALTLPFALIGGVAGAVLGGGVLSLGSLVGHRPGNRGAQRHHARQPLPTPRARGRRAVRPGPSRLGRAPGPDLDDRPGHRAGPGATGLGRQQAGP